MDGPFAAVFGAGYVALLVIVALISIPIYLARVAYYVKLIRRDVAKMRGELERASDNLSRLADEAEQSLGRRPPTRL